MLQIYPSLLNGTLSLAPSALALQKMIDMCFKYRNDYELKYNFKKTPFHITIEAYQNIP